MTTKPQGFIGQKFHRFTIVDVITGSRTEAAKFKCQCDCGNIKLIATKTVRIGETKSCGCLHRERLAERTTHGKSRSTEYHSWRAMIARCHNPANPDFASYGQRGITVCERWRNSFEAFLGDMGEKPCGKHSIDRYPDKTGNYEPGNCRWADAYDQSNNRSRTIMLTHRGITQSLADWARALGLKRKTVHSRYEEGLPIEKILYRGLLPRWRKSKDHT